jgi:Helix-turn-helix domain
MIAPMPYIPTTYCNHEAVIQVMDARTALHQKGLGPYELLALVIIASHARRDDRTTWISYRDLALESCSSQSTAIRSVKRLVKAGFLELIGTHPTGCNWYRIPITQKASGLTASISNRPCPCELTIPTENEAAR